jgi:hypothetical protein
MQANATLALIARSPRLDHLYSLRHQGYVTDAGAVALAESPFLHCLAHLRFDGSRLSETGELALRRATQGVWGRRGAEERSEPFFSWEA